MYQSSLIHTYNQQRRCADKRSICHAPTYGFKLIQDNTIDSIITLFQSASNAAPIPNIKADFF